MKLSIKNTSRLIFWVVYLAYTSIYVARINLSMAGPELISGGVLDTVQLGLLGSVFSTVFASGILINGGLSDKTPPWVMLTSGLALAGLSNLFVSFFPRLSAFSFCGQQTPMPSQCCGARCCVWFLQCTKNPLPSRKPRLWLPRLQWVIFSVS